MKVITIGRGGECSVVINDAKVSRMHAQLVQDDEGRISLVDLGSTNGTTVNGKRITGEIRLNPGDEVLIGDTVLPWQSYVTSGRAPSQSAKSHASVKSNTKGNMVGQTNRDKQRKMLWIIVAAALALIVGGGVVWLLNKGESEDVPTSPITDSMDSTATVKEISETEPTIASDNKEPDGQFSAYEQALWDKAQKEMAEVKSLKKDLEKQASDLKSKKDSLEGKDKVIKAKEIELAAKEKEINSKNETIKSKDKEIEKKDNVIKKKDEEITKKYDDIFNDLVKDMDFATASKVCKELKIKTKPNHSGDTLKKLIKENFAKKTDEAKKAMYEKVKKIAGN